MITDFYNIQNVAVKNIRTVGTQDFAVRLNIL